MMWDESTGIERAEPDRGHSMAQRQIAVTHKHVAALSGLKVYPGHLPLDGLCLEDLTRMGLIRQVRDGYALTPRGVETLDEEVATAKMRQTIYQEA